MKTIEEKAKAYDEAIEVARTLLNTRCVEGTNGYFHRKDIEQMFPILAESEDEKIRKAIINVFATHKDYEIFFGVSVKDILAWLEKQKDTLKDTLKDIEQNPAWSEEDEKKINYLIALLQDSTMHNPALRTVNEELENWLKSLKDRAQPQPKQEWSEEDERNLQGIIDEIEVNKHSAPGYNLATYDRFLSFLKSLRPQNNITAEELAQAKKEAYNDALDKIEYHSGEPTFDDGWSAAVRYLNKRNAQPRNTWKPKLKGE